jgi:hypothetical protein
MKARSVVVGVVAAVGMVVGSAGSASANIVWCSGDPPVRVDSPTGSNLTVGVTVVVPQGQAKYISGVVATAVTEPAPSGTLITVDVAVPQTIEVARVTVTVKKYKVSDYAQVPGGGSATLHLVVPAT